MDENLKLRKLLWLNHGHIELYGDDGEMQCQKCMIDFKRDSIDMIESAFEKSEQWNGLEDIYKAWIKG